jgi:hypothetical protein
MEHSHGTHGITANGWRQNITENQIRILTANVWRQNITENHGEWMAASPKIKSEYSRRMYGGKTSPKLTANGWRQNITENQI